MNAGPRIEASVRRTSPDGTEPPVADRPPPRIAAVAGADPESVAFGAQRGALTDPEGRYLVTGVPVGTYEVKAQFLGYRPESRTGVVVTSGRWVFDAPPFESLPDGVDGVSLLRGGSGVTLIARRASQGEDARFTGLRRGQRLQIGRASCRERVYVQV
jgi:hypothetical protein